MLSTLAGWILYVYVYTQYQELRRDMHRIMRFQGSSVLEHLLRGGSPPLRLAELLLEKPNNKKFSGC